MAPHGIYPILYAFYAEDGTLNRDAMHAQVNACIDAGAHGIAVLGLITEVAALSVVERETIIEWAAEDIAGRVPLAVTIAGDTPEAQLSLSKRAVDVGANWLILQPPKASQPSGRELMRFFGRVMDGVEVPVGIQNFPEVLGVGLTPPEVGELHRMHPNFTVMKGESPVFQIRQYIEASDGGIHILNGRGGIELVDNLRAGCAGIIPAPDCADVQIAMYNAYAQGDHARAERLYELTLPYVIFVMQSVDFALTYGKQLTARRLGITGPAHPRHQQIAADAFGEERLHHHARFMRAFGHWQE